MQTVDCVAVWHTKTLCPSHTTGNVSIKAYKETLHTQKTNQLIDFLQDF